MCVCVCVCVKNNDASVAREADVIRIFVVNDVQFIKFQTTMAPIMDNKIIIK